MVVTSKDKTKYLRGSLAPLGNRSAKGDYVISLRSGETVRLVVPYAPRIESGGSPDA